MKKQFIQVYIFSMLSLPDIKHKQILFIQIKPGLENELKLTNENLIQKEDGKIINKISIHKLLVIYILGDFTITSKIIQKLLKFGVSIYFLSRNFSCYASLEAKAEGNFLVKQKQYNIDEIAELGLAKSIVTEKIKNQRQLLLEKEFKATQLTDFKKFLDDTAKAENEKVLLGIEGSAAKLYFKMLFQKTQITWLRRLPQTKIDVPNLLLDIGYTYLFNFVDSLLRLYGFDTYKGVYHKLFFQRKSLACDIMEPFRPMIDKSLIKAYNLNQINQKDFKVKSGCFFLEYQNSSKYSAIFFKAILENKVEILTFVQSYYRYFMRPDKYKFPKAKI